MVNVKFYDEVKDELLEYAVIVSKYENKWLFCKHKNRSTYEIPGGHREKNEPIIEAAKRELWEETGAKEYFIEPVCIYSVEGNGQINFGMLYFADIRVIDKLPSFEIEKIELFDDLPENLTYPLIQPLLFDKVKNSNVNLV